MQKTTKRPNAKREPRGRRGAHISAVVRPSLITELELAWESEKIGLALDCRGTAAALNVADYGYVLENGSINISGPAEKLRNDPAVQAAYLGAAH